MTDLTALGRELYKTMTTRMRKRFEACSWENLKLDFAEEFVVKENKVMPEEKTKGRYEYFGYENGTPRVTVFTLMTEDGTEIKGITIWNKDKDAPNLKLARKIARGRALKVLRTGDTLKSFEHPEARKALIEVPCTPEWFWFHGFVAKSSE